MRRPLVAGNWKMNGSLAASRELIGGLLEGLGGINDAEVAVCPPFVYLPEVSALLGDSSVALGAQNVCDQDQGAFTGEVAGDMLREFGCRYVIVGHSERRHVYGETDALVAARFTAAQRHGLVPILCVGETLDEREGGATDAVLARQLDAVIELAGAGALAEAVIAYEPVWAIGTGRTATPEQAQSAHAFLRSRVADRDAGLAEGLRLLYGGSVKPANAAELFAQPDVDGGLIGGAALKAGDFIDICAAARSGA
ncbi:triose-phosphate isomerase [Ectothiorhodospiraceae bacterium WFHF3C12]|nr:triose-phosphate isomerase [Ectothiorhodospiraceae bacterium WFHF3C12]